MKRDYDAVHALAKFYVNLAHFEDMAEEMQEIDLGKDFDEARTTRELTRLFNTLVCEMAHKEVILSEKERYFLELLAEKLFGKKLPENLQPF